MSIRVNERITKNKILETSIFMFNEIYDSKIQGYHTYLMFLQVGLVLL